MGKSFINNRIVTTIICKIDKFTKSLSTPEGERLKDSPNVNGKYTNYNSITDEI